MLTPQQAVQKASDTTRWAIGMCDNFVANMFGYNASGYPTAINHWNSIPSQDKHPGDMNAPAGALMFWGGGSAGHVALSDGHGGIFTTDYPQAGMVSHVDSSVISKSWGKPYLGWSLPVFQGQVGSVADASFTIPVPGTGGITVPTSPGDIAGSVGSATINALSSAFGTDFKDIVQRLALMFFGAIVLIIGVVMFTGQADTLESLAGVQLGKSKEEKAKQEEETEQKDAVQARRKQRRNVEGSQQGDGGGEKQAHNQGKGRGTNPAVGRARTRLAARENASEARVSE